MVIERYRQAYVARFTEDEVHEIWQLRARLEGYAARRAAARITPAALERLESLEAEMEQVYDQRGWVRSVQQFDELNAAFHMVIAEAADSPRVRSMLTSSLELPAAILTRYAEPVDDRIRRTFWQHREIIAALRLGNPEWAEAQMFAHLVSLIIPAGGRDHGPEDGRGELSPPPADDEPDGDA